MPVHGKRTRVLVDDFNVSPFFRESNKAQSKDEVDVTTYGADDDKDFMPGYSDSTMTLNGLFDTTTVLDVAANPDTTPDLFFDELFELDPVVLMAHAADGLAHGKPVVMFEANEMSYDLNNVIGDVVTIATTFKSRNEDPDSGRRGMAKGYSLHDITSAEAATGDDAVLDNGAQSLNGGIAQLHVIDNSRDGGSTLKVQHSTDDVVWVDLATFSVVGAGLRASQRIVIPEGTTVHRRLRVNRTLAGTTGTVTYHAAFARL